MKFFKTITIVSSLLVAANTQQSCKIDLRYLENFDENQSIFQPIFLKPNSAEFFQPDDDSVMRLAENQKIELVCNSPGGFNAPAKVIGKSSITLVCSVDQQFKYRDEATNKE